MNEPHRNRPTHRPGPDISRLLSGVLLLLSLQPSQGFAQSETTVTLGGEIRPRLFAQKPGEGEWDHWISMRSRLALNARLEGGLGLFLQVQDVRYWGEELTNRDRTADAIDFHQAYLEVDSLPAAGGLIRAGRQEVSLAQGRFLAAPNWGQAGQTFDGIRWIRFLGAARLDLVYLRLREGSSDVHETSADLSAAWAAFPERAFGSLDFLALHDRSGGPRGNHQSTVGSIWKLHRGVVGLQAQGMYQFGERSGTDVSAYMVALQASVDILAERGSVTLWLDHLSGDEDPFDDEVGVFSTLFGARHRFYGRADYFSDIPEDTGGLGLRDAAVKLAFAPSSLSSVNVDFHAFRTAELGELSSRRLAEEVDVWIRYRFRESLALESGAAVIFGGPAMEELGRLEGTGHAGYFMASLYLE